MDDRPLRGVRVLDLTNVLAGPYCSYQLMLLGAEVVKIEKPGHGDLARQLGPEPGLNQAGIGASFLAQNAGKKSVELDLKDPRDRAAFDELLARRRTCCWRTSGPASCAGIGYGWDVLHAANPRLVYCAISGFGQTGPMSQAPAYDQIIQGLSGMMSITGTPETAPLRVGFPVSDSVGGLVAAMAICAALAGRARTGEGVVPRRVHAGGVAVGHGLGRVQLPRQRRRRRSRWATRTPPRRRRERSTPRTARSTSPPTGRSSSRRCAGWSSARISLTDERFADREARKANRAALNDEINAALRRRPALEWEQMLSGAGVPGRAHPDRSAGGASWNSCASAASSPICRSPAIPAGRCGSAATACSSTVTRCVRTSPPPLLGEHNDELGLSTPTCGRRRGGGAVSEAADAEPTVQDVSRLVGDGGLPRRARRHRAARPPDPGTHRHHQLRRHRSGCCCAANRRRPAQERLLEAALVVLRGPRPARAVDRGRPDGRHLRRRPEQRGRQRGQHCWATSTAAPASSAWSCSPR